MKMHSASAYAAAGIYFRNISYTGRDVINRGDYMAEQQNISNHHLTLDNRAKGTITGVTDVIAFDDKEILLKTKAGTMTIRGAALTLTRLDLDHGETDIQGKVDSIVYSKDQPKNKKPTKTVARRWW